MRSASYSPSASPRFDPISADPTALFRPRACRGTTIVPPRRKPVILEIRERSGADRLAGSDGDSAPRGARVPAIAKGAPPIATRCSTTSEASLRLEVAVRARGRCSRPPEAGPAIPRGRPRGSLRPDGWSRTVRESGRQPKPVCGPCGEFSDPAAFSYGESDRLYEEWKASQPEPARQRAWLVRGFSVLGANIVPERLAHGFCSLAASQPSNP